MSSVSVEQDFFASMFIVNLQAIIINDVRSEMKEGKSKKGYKYKVNRNLSLGFMKNRVLQIFLESDKNKNTYDELKALFKMETVPIRPGRKNRRKKKWNNRKFHMNQKISV